MTVFHKMNIKQMNKEIHYKCRCTGQRFTFKEWCNYLKGNPPKVVHTYKEFCFNIADVCLTPHIKIDWAKKVLQQRNQTMGDGTLDLVIIFGHKAVAVVQLILTH